MIRGKVLKQGWGVAGLLMGLLLVGTNGVYAAKTPVVATVNGVAITSRSFNRALAQVQRRFAQSGKKLEGKNLANVRKNILETLIDRELLYQESEKDGIKVPKEKVNQQVESLKKQFPEKGAFEKALKTVDMTEQELRDQIRRQLAVREMIDTKIAPKVNVSEKEVRAFYDSHTDIFKRPEEVRASHILVKVASDADKKTVAAARKKIEAAQKRIKKGEDFAKVAKEVSEGPSAKQGGDLGYFRRGQMVKPFEDAAFGMKVGQVSGVVRTRFGFHLIKVTGKKPASMVPYVKVKDKIRDYLKQKKIQEEVQAMLKSLRQKAKITTSMPQASK